MAKNRHTWKFFRAGDFNQVSLESGADLLALDQLDQKLWVALACPTRGIEFDIQTLDLIDTDKDGRIRVPEIIAAAKWVGARLKNPDDLLKSSPALPLGAIDEGRPEGKTLLASAKQILENLGKGAATSITIEDTTDTKKIFEQTLFNGDGIVPPDSASDPATKNLLTDVITCLGSDTDRSGKPGVNQTRLDQFFAEATAYSDWQAKAETEASSILPLGEATPAAYGALLAVKAKVDDYFARCRWAAFDSRALTALNREEKDYLSLASKDLSVNASEITSFPLARIEVDRPLPLSSGVNPAWSGPVTNFQQQVVTPVLGERSVLTEPEWAVITAKFAAHEAWFKSKAGASVEKLGLPRIREILAGKERELATALIAKDKSLEPEVNAIADVDKLVRYHRDLYKLCNNFVSFRDFYERKEPAVFQAGTLYLDQRSCDLCIQVADAGKHALMAGLAGTYLAYCDCVRKSTGQKMQVAVAFTGGDSYNLMVGRNGVFYDRKGCDWDATITKIIENPISIRQAFFAPYRKVVRMIEESVAKRLAEADMVASAKLAQTAKAVSEPDKLKPVPEPAKHKIDTGTLAAIGLVLTTLLSALGTIFSRILGLAWWQIPLAFLCIILAISAPSTLMAWLKLRKRNLGPILDANGWAVNASARMNVPFGGSLTQVAELPIGSVLPVVDPFAEKKSPWPTIILFLLILTGAYVALSKLGFLN